MCAPACRLDHSEMVHRIAFRSIATKLLNPFYIGEIPHKDVPPAGAAFAVERFVLI